MTYWIENAPGNLEPRTAENGYSILPGGMMIQWGGIPNEYGGGWHNFHTPFPNECFMVLVNQADVSGDFENVRVDHIERTRFSAWGKHALHANGGQYIAIGR